MRLPKPKIGNVFPLQFQRQLVVMMSDCLCSMEAAKRQERLYFHNIKLLKKKIQRLEDPNCGIPNRLYRLDYAKGDLHNQEVTYNRYKAWKEEQLKEWTYFNNFFHACRKLNYKVMVKALEDQFNRRFCNLSVAEQMNHGYHIPDDIVVWAYDKVREDKRELIHPAWDAFLI